MAFLYLARRHRHLVLLLAAAAIVATLYTQRSSPVQTPHADTRDVSTFDDPFADSSVAEWKDAQVDGFDESRKPETGNNLTLSPTQHNLDQEKFMTFLPHSGFHNQRFSLINAVMIAYWLNRTLIIPPANLGSGIWWKRNPINIHRLDYCPDISERNALEEKRTHTAIKMESYCYDFRKYTPIRFDKVLDLSAIEKIIKIMHREDLHQRWFEITLGIPSKNNESMVYTLKDNARYSYRIYDTRSNTADLSNYKYRVDVDDLRARKEKLLLFGSVFGGKRLALSTIENKALHEHLMKSLPLNHELVIHSANKIVEKLGGTAQFVGVHVRTGDGIFKERLNDTIIQMETTLEKLAANGARKDYRSVEDTKSVMEQVTRSLISLQHNPMQLLQECLKYSDHGELLTIIYMATDSRKPPRKNPALKDIFVMFPCTFTLIDFAAQGDIDNLKVYHTDGRTLLDPMLIPMVDVIVASRGKMFVGTRSSTFSMYAKHMNEALLASLAEPILAQKQR